MGTKTETGVIKTLSRDDTATFLRELSQGLDKGELRITLGGEEVRLAPPEALSVEVELKDKGDKKKLSIKLKWREGAVGDGPTLGVATGSD